MTEAPPWPPAAVEDFSPRHLALKILCRLEAGEARARDLMEEAMRAAAAAGKPLAPPEASLLQDLVQGTLRHRGRLDYYLARVSHRPLEQLSPWVRNLVRLALHELLHLPAGEGVEALEQADAIARLQGHEGALKFVHGCLRELCRLKEEGKLPPPPAHPVARLAVEKSHPLWLAARLVELYGFDRAEGFLEASFAPPPLTLRAHAYRMRRDDLAGRLIKAGLRVEPCRYSPWGLRVRDASDPRRLPGYGEGEWALQDESSQLVVRLLAPQPHWQVADVCAAPGGKAGHLAELLLPGGRVWAFDRKAQAIEKMAASLRRLRLPNLLMEVRDAAFPREDLLGRLDAVVVDAPCSALGVLRRRPEARWQIRPETIPFYAARQLRLLSASARYLKPGGVLVYAACTLEEQENEDVVRAFLDQHPNFVFERAQNFLERELCTPDGFFRVWPGQEGMDGFFGARLRRVR